MLSSCNSENTVNSSLLIIMSAFSAVWSQSRTDLELIGTRAILMSMNHTNERLCFFTTCSHIREPKHMKLFILNQTISLSKLMSALTGISFPVSQRKLFCITCNMTPFHWKCQKLKLGLPICKILSSPTSYPKHILRVHCTRVQGSAGKWYGSFSYVNQFSK